MTLIEAARLALGELSKIAVAMPYPVGRNAITALQTAIAEAEKQEPVAWQATADKCQIQTVPAKGGLLPTAPPAAQRQWVGLTGEETTAIELGLRIPTGYRDAYDLSLRDFAHAIEAKLKEKNT